MTKETGKGRIPSLDGLRTIAIVLVFNTHFFGYFFNRKAFDGTAPGCWARRHFNTSAS